MDRTLLWRAITILVVVLVCIYGIVGLPKSRAELAENLQKNIKLGLDLRGGSHLILEVQVQDPLALLHLLNAGHNRDPPLARLRRAIQHVDPSPVEQGAAVRAL